MVPRFSWLLLLLVLIGTAYASDQAGSPLEDELVGVKLGAAVEELQKLYPELYRHRLALGEVLYEACNQKELEVFTFTAEPWSPGSITHIWIRKEKDVAVCRDDSGALPDLAIRPITPRGIRLGESRQAVLEKYGPPSEERPTRDGSSMLSYKGSVRPGQLVENLTLSITVTGGLVTSFSLRGDIPGVKKPFTDRPRSPGATGG